MNQNFQAARLVEPSPKPSASVWQTLSYVLLALIAVWMLLTFDQHGISNDEYVQHTYGQLLLQWYRSGFTDTAAFHFKNLYLYGGLFDLLAAWLETHTSLWIWDLRHLLTAGFGWLGFYGCYRFACLIDGPRLGLVCLILLSVTVSWTGTVFTHTKDIPFATCMLWASYASAKIAHDLQRTTLNTSLLLGLAVGAALGLRIGGAFAVLQLLIILGWQSWQTRARVHLSRWGSLQWGWQLSRPLLPAAGLAWAIMVICWPWSMQSPGNILVAVRAFSHFNFNMQTMLNGQVYAIAEVPRSYLFQYLAVKLPEATLAGLVCLLAVCMLQRWRPRQTDKYPVALPSGLRTTSRTEPAQAAQTALIISLLFPLLYVCFDKPALYNGVRHFTFVLPLITLLAAQGLLCAYDWIATRHLLWAAWFAGCLSGLVTFTAGEMVTLHPYEYIRLNILAGSPAYAHYRWEGEYWSSALREASQQLQRIPLPAQNHPYLVAACVDTTQMSPYLDKNKFVVTRDWVRADFFVSTTNMHCHEVLKGEVVGEVSRDGLLLAVVKDRRALSGDDRLPTPAKN